MTTRITGTNITDGSIVGSDIAANTITTSNLNSSVISQLNTAPTITQIQITNSSYTVLDDTAVASTGGYIKITGTNFTAGSQVVIGSVAATSVGFVSSTTLNVQVPAQAAGTYIVYVTTNTGSVAILVNGLTYSGTPIWVTGSTLSGSPVNQAISIQLSATGDAPVTYTLQAGSSLPAGLSLSSGGLLSGTVTGISVNTTYNFTIEAIDAEAQESPRAFSITITVSDVYFPLVSMLLAGNGTNGAQNNTFLDSSTNAYAITRLGDTMQGTFTPFGTGWSTYFNGSTDYFSMSDNNAFQYGAGDFALECWVYPTATLSSNYIVSQWYTGDKGIILGIAGGSLSFYYSTTGSNDIILVSATNPTLNRWSHILACRTGNTISLFLNGTRVATTTESGTLNNSTTTIGIATHVQGLGSSLWPGYISNLRSIAGSNPYDATQSTITVPTTALTAVANTRLLICASNRFIDTGPSNFTLTRAGTPSIQRYDPFNPDAIYSAGGIGGSGYFDGNNDRLTVTNAAFDLSSNSDFTIEAFFYAGVISGYMYQNYGNYGNVTGQGIYVDLSALSVTFENWTGSDQGPTFSLSSSNIIQPNQWNHVAVVRSGSASNNISLFVNGVRSNQGTLTSFPAPTQVNTSIGSRVYQSTASLFYTGYISGLRVVRGTGAALYSGTTYTVPSTPPTAVANTAFLCNFTNAGVIDNAMINDIDTYGNVQISTVQSKWGGGSLAFDGNSDGLFVPYNVNLTMPGNFTVEFWIYFNSKSGYQTIYSFGYAVAGGFIIQTGNGDGKMVVYSGPSATIVASDAGSTVNTGQWYHIAVVRSGSTTTIYRDGVSVGSGADTTSYSPAAGTYAILGGGSSSSFNNYYLNGYIDDFRITKGYARYTSNFTPPTGPFELS